MYRRAKKLHRDLVENYGSFVDEIERKLETGRDNDKVPNCLSKSMLQSREKEGLDDLDIKILASAFMIGSVETVPTLPPSLP
jgi:hypothetical protein